MSNLKTLSTFFNRNFSLTRLSNALALELNAQYILDDIYTHFYNIETADGYWLDVWGRIVAMPRSVSLPSTNYFGFYGTPFTPFNHAPFYGGIPDLNNVTMDDTIYRKAIKAKALANRSGRTIPDINAVLALFMDNTCYALDGYDMSVTFSIAPSWSGSTELAVIMSDVLGLRPAAVKLNVVLRPTYAIAPDTSTINETDANDVTFTVTTANVPDGTTLYYTALDITTEGAADLTPINGSVVIADNTGSFVISAIADVLTEGSEGFQAQLRTDSVSGTVVATSILITILDTSIAVSYAITPATSSVNEGSSLAVTVNTVGIPGGTTLYWTVLNGTTANADFTAVSGGVVIASDTASFNIAVVADLLTEGSESFTVQLRTGSISGEVVATSSTITITDTSINTSFRAQFEAFPFVDTSGNARAIVNTAVTQTSAWSSEGTYSAYFPTAYPDAGYDSARGLGIQSGSDLFSNNTFAISMNFYLSAGYKLSEFGDFRATLFSSGASSFNFLQCHLTCTTSSYTGLSFELYNTNATATIVTQAYSFLLNTAYNIKLTYNRTTNVIEMYINNVLVQTVTNTAGTAYLGNGAPLTFGITSLHVLRAWQFKGCIDDIIITG